MSEPTTASRPPNGDAGPSRPAWHVHRHLYDWVLHWAETPYGAPALFLLAFAESSFFPIPPDVLLIALVLGARRRWFRLALICSLGSVFGGVAGYAIGYGLMESVGRRIIDFYHAQEHWDKVTELYTAYDVWVVFVAAFTPIPYKVFTIASGAFDMNLPAFCVVSAVGRGARFFIVAGLLYLFGPPMKRFIDRYFDWLALAFVVLLVGGFAAIKLVSTGD
jgi:membrane protein YqaA with SNARE-associated domain